MSDAIETKVGYWANFHHVPTVSIDTSGWTDEQRASFMAELERQNEQARVESLVKLGEALR